MFLIIVLLIGGYSFLAFSKHTVVKSSSQHAVISKTTLSKSTILPKIISSLSIIAMRKKSYPGSKITVDQTLANGSNYARYLVTYDSDGLKINALLTVPFGIKPKNGWPVILFNHGYIPPATYSTVTSYNIMIDPLASSGYIVFAPDYRGNDNSQGVPMQPYISSDYITDSMNAYSSIKEYKDVDPKDIGVFGHSMGGNITLHELVITHDFKAAEIMAGVVGDETSLLSWWNHRFVTKSIEGNDLDTYNIVIQMEKENGTPGSNPNYWNDIDPTKYLTFITTPIQIQVGSADNEVPVDFSSTLYASLQKEGIISNYHVFQGADHNLSPDTAEAMADTVSFFNTYLKK